MVTYVRGTAFQPILQAMNWSSIRLELARTRDFPAGSVGRAYLICLPLDDQDNIDEAAFSRAPARATVRRHWSAEPDQKGHLVRENGEWLLLCEGNQRTLRVNSEPVRLGARVSLIEANGDVLPFRVASIR